MAKRRVRKVPVKESATEGSGPTARKGRSKKLPITDKKLRETVIALMGSKNPASSQKVESASTTSEVPVRRIPPGVGGRVPLQDWDAVDPIDRLSDMEKLSIQLDLAAGLPKRTIASKFGLSSRQVTKIGSMNLNLSGQMRERLEATATNLVTHSHRMFNSITQAKVDKADLTQLSISGAIAIDKALMIDKHLHGSKDAPGDLILNFGSREALEKAIVRKFKDNPLFRSLKARETDHVVVDAVEESVAGTEQLDLFPGTEERRASEGEPVVSFAGKELLAPGMLRGRKPSKEELRQDRELERELDEDWGDWEDR